MSDNFVHLLILLGVAGGAIPTRPAPAMEPRPAPVTVAACRTVADGKAVAQPMAACARPSRGGIVPLRTSPPAAMP